MCSPIELDVLPGSRGTDKRLPEHQDGIRFQRVAASSGNDSEETFFPHESISDDDADLSDGTDRGQGFLEVIKNAAVREINRGKKKLSREYDAQRKKMEKQLEQKDGEIKTLREELASKEVTLKQTVSELDKQTEEKRKQAVTIRCLELKLTNVTEDSRKLQGQLKVTEEQCQGLKRKHRSEIESLESSKAFAASVLEKERADNRDKNTKLSERELELTVSQEACSQKRLEIQKLKDELSVMKASNTQLTKTTKDLQCRNEALQRELETKTSALDGIMSVSVELTNKVKDVKEQQTNNDEESDGRAVDSSMYCIDEDDIDSLPPLSMEVLADYIEEITPKWDLVGHSLSVGTSVIQSLRDQPYSPQSKCTQVLEKWLEGDPDFSWIKLFDVLKRQRLNSLMSRMFQRLKPKPQ